MNAASPKPRVPRIEERSAADVINPFFDMEDSVRSVCGLAAAARTLIAGLPPDGAQAAAYAVARALETEAGVVLADWEAAIAAAVAIEARRP